MHTRGSVKALEQASIIIQPTDRALSLELLLATLEDVDRLT